MVSAGRDANRTPPLPLRFRPWRVQSTPDRSRRPFPADELNGKFRLGFRPAGITAIAGPAEDVIAIAALNVGYDRTLPESSRPGFAATVSVMPRPARQSARGS